VATTLLNALRASQGGPPTSMENFLLGELRRAIEECGTCVAVIKPAARGDAQLRWDIKKSPTPHEEEWEMIFGL